MLNTLNFKKSTNISISPPRVKDKLNIENGAKQQSNYQNSSQMGVESINGKTRNAWNYHTTKLNFEFKE